jgi:Tol biopolymer transport system component
LPEPSPDGREVAFQSQRSGTRDIFVMPAEGGAAQPVRVAPGDDNGPFWSPDGKRLGFFSAGGDLENGTYAVERTESGWSAPQPWTDGPLLRPDGRARIAWSPDSIVERSVDDGSTTLLWARRGASDPTPRRLRVHRTPDGTRIYFQGILATTSPRFGIWEVSMGRGTAREVVRFDDPDRLPLWGGFAASGTHLYFTLDERQSDLWIADLHVK